jgi:O-antigen/teichoic acid export membrane protein
MWTPIRLLQFLQLSRHASLLFYAVLLPSIGFYKGEIGSFELLQLLAFSLSFFWISGFIQGLMHIYPTLPEKDKQNFIPMAFWIFFIINLLLVSIISLGVFFDLKEFRWLGYISFFPMYLVYLLFNVPSQLLEYVLFLEQSKWLKVFCLFSFPIQAVFFSVPLLLFNSLTLAVSGLFLWALFRFLFFTSHYVIHHLSIPRKMIYRWIKYSIPLIFSSLLGGLGTVVNALFVHNHFNGNPAIFAIYRYGARELPFLNGLYEGLGVGIIPALVTDMKKGLYQLRRSTLNLLHLIFPIAIILTLFVNLWFPLLFTHQFQDSIPIFKIFLLLVPLRLVPTNSVLNALGKSKILLIIGLTELLIQVFCSLLGLNFFGLIGMAFATLIAYIFEKLAGLMVLKYQHQISLDQMIPMKWWLFYTLLLIVSYFISSESSIFGQNF